MARKLTTSAADAGQKLFPWLAKRLGIPVDAAIHRVLTGAVYVDGSRERDPGRLLGAGLKITVHDPTPSSEANWRVVHEAAGVIVVDKPAGLPVAAERAGGRALDAEILARYPGTRLFHRIDRETSGLVLFTRGREARQHFASALDRGELVRGYVAVVDGAYTGPEVLDLPIGPDPDDHRRHKAGVPGARPARTLVAVREEAAGRTVLEVTLDTGLTHQIRVHLAAAGYPVVGDPLYGGTPARRMALHAERLAWPGGEALAPLSLLPLL